MPKKLTKRKRSLSIRERKFLVAYLSGATGAKAARDAGYSADSARQTAYELLTKPYIREAVDNALRSRQLSPEQIVAELETIAHSTIKELWNEKGVLLPNDLPDAVARAVKKFKAHPASGVEIEMYGKLEALGLLGKLHKLFVDRHELTGKDGKALIPIEALSALIDEADRIDAEKKK